MPGLFVDLSSEAMQACQRWQQTDPVHAAIIYQIASRPQAVWLCNNGNGITVAEQATYNAASATSYPVFVPFTILEMPPPDYLPWIKELAQVISAVDSVVIIEPNVLPQSGLTYAASLSESVDILKASGKTRVYLDVGHAAWHDAAPMIDYLNAAGIAKPVGFFSQCRQFPHDRRMRQPWRGDLGRSQLTASPM